MSIQVGNKVVTLPVTAYVKNLNVANLPGCAPDTAPSVDSTCSRYAGRYKHWGYWDFTGGGEHGVCNEIDTSALSVTLILGTSMIFAEACCTSLCPDIFSVNIATFCSVTASTLIGTPSSGPSASPSTSPSGPPRTSPYSGPSFKSIYHSVLKLRCPRSNHHHFRWYSHHDPRRGGLCVSLQALPFLGTLSSKTGKL
jgi:hypothetical protein